MGAATSDRIVVGTGLSLADITTGVLMAWVNVAVLATNQRLYQKGVLGTLRRFQLTSSRFGMSLARATTNQDAQANATDFAAYALNKWLCVAMVFDLTAASGDQKVYLGDQFQPLAEPSSYVTQTVGSGIITTDAAETSFIGNNSATNVSWSGLYGFCGIWNRPVPYADLERQRQQFVQPSSELDTMGAVLYAFPGINGGTTVLDYSGYGNHGLITGAVISGGSPPFQFLQAA